MSDIEEPPTKVAKYEMSQTFTQVEELEELQEEGQEEGQEEWLSEDMLTDDDGNPAEQDNSATNAAEDSQVTADSQPDADASKVDDSNIEQTLNTLDSQTQMDLPDELDTFLIRKTDGKVLDGKMVDVKAKEDESDGNDTDDLLRMLEDDDKTKKKTKSKPANATSEKQQEAQSSDDDDYFEGATFKQLKVAKNVIRKFPVSKAVPEDTSTDESSDEASTMQKMFVVKKTANFAAKSTAKPASKPASTPASKPASTAQVTGKPVVRTVGEGRATSTPLAMPVPLPRPRPRPVPRPARTYHNANKSRNTPAMVAPQATVLTPPVKIAGERHKEVQKPKISQSDLEEIINEEEFLEDEDFDLDETFAEESDSEVERRASRQRIMRPERMDEEMLSDADSRSDDGYQFDELPSSESEDDVDDWFTIDVRAERAGEYLPLLGTKAYELLTQEKKRVASRLDTLRQSISTLSETGRKQAEKLKMATASLAAIDDMLKAS